MTGLTRPANAPALYSQDGKGYQATVTDHYFVANADWFITEYDPDTDIAFGWCCLGDRQMAELGYVSIAELEATRIPITVNNRPGWSIAVDHDDYWQPVSLAQAIADYDGRNHQS